MSQTIESRLQTLIGRGVVVVDPRQTYVAPEVDPERVFPGSVLFPGARLCGARTLVGSRAQIGTEGPAVLRDAVVGAGAEVASGFLAESTLLPGAKAGANAHFRAGTLLEEEASTAHAVGLKQSILMYSVTLGSLINLCDALVSGGRSRAEHTEIGSGFIHFNFTPWGKRGDKATPTLIGNVTEGVFLDQERIFLGGMSGIVGPDSVGFGAMTVAGQVIRKPVPGGTMHAEFGREFDRSFVPTEAAFSDKHLARVRARNLEFIAQLYALKAWYSEIRLKRSLLQKDAELSLVLSGALETIRCCLDERFRRYNSFAAEWAQPLFDPRALDTDAAGPAFAFDWKLDAAYDKWVAGLGEGEKRALHDWLAGHAARLKQALQKQNSEAEAGRNVRV